MMTKSRKIVGPFNQVVSLSNTPQKGKLSAANLTVHANTWLLIEDGKILKFVKDNISSIKAAKALVQRVPKGLIVIPGLIDAHTHICFGGSRANDYAMRNAGKSYLEIAQTGGGIADTVRHTRASSQEELEQGILDRIDEMIMQGITTIEVKSGYGLSVKEELKMLRAIKAANDKSFVDLIPTCLAAHIKPKSFAGSHQAYLEHIATKLFPILKEKSLANRIDIFIEEEAFSQSISENYFEKAKSMGFDLIVHADQFTPGGSSFAVRHKALSADHLEASGKREIANLAKSETVAMALPGASIGLGCNFTPARKLLDAGACVAIASDWNPGSAPMGKLLMQATTLQTFEKLNNAEVLAGITKRAGQALKLSDRGSLAVGEWADMAIFQAEDYNEIFYRQGSLTPSMVFKRGELIFER